jgi:3',5'-cyclic AMP phosphodiesterase CpdA
MKPPASSFQKATVWAALFGIALVCLGCIHTVQGGQPFGEARFHFVQISDTHLGERDHLERIRELVGQINRLPFDIACVVHTGDIFADNLADEKTLAEGLSVLKQLKAPVHLVPGNHDILEQNLESTLWVYTQRVGPLIYQRKYHGVEFIFAYTEPLALGFEVKGYDVLKELNKALIRADGKPVLLFHHRPAVEDYYEFARYPGWGSAARRQFDELLSAFNVTAVITGHFHRDELHWAGSIPIFAAPPVAGYWGRQASFRLYEYADGKLAHRTIYLRE